MRVKRFTGQTMQEAVAQLRAEFGRDAVILHTRQKRRGFIGLFGRPLYEIIGAVDPESNTAREPKPEVKTVPERPPAAPAPKSHIWPEDIASIYQALLATGIPRDTANGLLGEVLRGLPEQAWSNEQRIWHELANHIARQVSTVEPWTFEDGQGIAVFIGPTGVGKTTTIAKLAANFALVAGKKVGVITTDTYRIAAVDQLRTYADIIGIPFEVVFSPKELHAAAGRLQDRDLILIDTAGRSPNNQLHINELRNYFNDMPVEVHLVVSATTKEADVPRLVEVFGEIPIDRVIITKLDETTTYGIILHVSKLAKAPISFVTTGQGVPDDIEVADGQYIAKLILGDFL
ncbi:MAG TPA: flagellar biosynthesis protein FlhF [Firmicutes bacterium]|nr:flagellar biosynthesis protein FlhF [Bacillota bacterium]